MTVVLGINPPAGLGAAFLQCVLIQLHSEVALLESFSRVFSGSNSPYDNLPANSTQPSYFGLVSLCSNASLPAVEDSTYFFPTWKVM